MKTLSNEQLLQLQTYLQKINTILGLTHPADSLSQPVPDVHTTQRPSARPRKRTAHRVTTATFTYRWLASAPQRITMLYQYLIRAKWIASDTTPDDFFSLFEGKDSPVHVKWTGTSLQLAYLIRVLTDSNYITVPKGTGKWTCVYNHLTDKNNRQLPKLNSLHTPLKSKTAIEQLAEVLNPGQ
jgi:hypothetical protein